MTRFVYHHDIEKLPPFSTNIHPVLMYNVRLDSVHTSSVIGGPIIEKIRDLGTPVSSSAFDFLTIALAMTAADTFCRRDDAANSWARDLQLEIPLFDPSVWNPVAKELETALGFLTGDQWSLNFIEGGLAPPSPKNSKKAKNKKSTLRTLDCVCLFSGGLDSAVGAVDLVHSNNKRKPLLVSHGYKGDAKKQSLIEDYLEGEYSRLALNVDPHIIRDLEDKTDISMRGRSFNFIAMAVVGLSALQLLNTTDLTDIIIPENGYISLNPPLTRRRIGTLSTRTTHPYFLKSIQEILRKAGLRVTLTNPYQFKTKGEMLKECADQDAIKQITPISVSCSNWHRKGIQCGRCVPCLIRRSSIHKAGIGLDSPYDTQDVASITSLGDTKDDMLALSMAILRSENGLDFKSWVRQNGPLPEDTSVREQLVDVAKRGLNEVKEYLVSEGAI